MQNTYPMLPPSRFFLRVPFAAPLTGSFEGIFSVKIKDFTLKKTLIKRNEKGGSFVCDISSECPFLCAACIPCIPWKRTLKRKGKHTKTNSFPFPREGSSPFSFKGLLGLFFSPSFKGYNKQEIKAYSLLNISYRFVLSLNLFKI